MIDMLKLIPKLRYPSRCRKCGTDISVGSPGFHDAETKTVECVSCHEGSPVLRLPTPQPASELAAQPEPNVAGASARAESERARQRDAARHDKDVVEDQAWRESIVEKRRVLGRIAVWTTPKPEFKESRRTRNYGVGADGEEIVGEWLAKAPGVDLLHDRHWPGATDANIDHIAVGPSGIFVVDAKKYTGRIDTRQKGNLFKSDVRLYVGKNDRTKVVDGVLAQVEAVRSVLGAEFESVPIRGALCFVEGDWGFPKMTLKVKGVTVLWPNKLPELVSATGPHGDVVATVAKHLRAALPSAL